MTEETSGSRFRERFEQLPREAQDAVLGHLAEALHWRGRDRDIPITNHAKEAVTAIAEIFAANGMEIWEYT